MSQRLQDPRCSWKSSLGFLLAATGSAVGLGNIWRFPYVVGTNGGAAFMIIYLLLVAIIGLPLLLAELTVGRSTGQSPVSAFKKLAPGTKWWFCGLIFVITGFVILSFYSVVAGWALSYFFKTIRGVFASEPDFAEIFVNHITGSTSPLIWHFVFMLLTIGIICAGVVKGIERSVRIMMPVLSLLLIVLVVRALTLPGAGAGLTFYLKPDFSEITPQTLLSAIGQAFYTLSLGMGVMITYASYLDKKSTIPDKAIGIIGIDTLIALIAGFIIFPAVFALGLDPSAGAGLAFKTLPAVFAQIPGGIFFGAVFFLLLSIAALTSALSLLEVVVSWLIDEHKWSRIKASLLMGLLIFLLGIPASLSFGAWSGFTIAGMNFFDFLDFLQESILLPLGGLLIAIFVGYVWKAHKSREEANNPACRFRIGKWYDFSIRFILPVAIAIVMVFGLIDRFKPVAEEEIGENLDVPNAYEYPVEANEIDAELQ